MYLESLKTVYNLRCEPDARFFLLSVVVLLLRLAVSTLVVTSSCSRAKKADDDFGTFSLLSLICFNARNHFIIQLPFYRHKKKGKKTIGNEFGNLQLRQCLPSRPFANCGGRGRERVYCLNLDWPCPQPFPHVHAPFAAPAELPSSSAARGAGLSSLFPLFLSILHELDL